MTRLPLPRRLAALLALALAAALVFTLPSITQAARSNAPLAPSTADLASAATPLLTRATPDVRMDPPSELVEAIAEAGHAPGLAEAVADALTEDDKLTASDGAGGDGFGWSVSLSGSRALVGALSDDDNGTNSGSAYVFVFDGDSWSQEAKLTASDGERFDYFGDSVSLSGNRALIGAPEDNDDGDVSGSAYIFDFDGNRWTQTAKLTASDAASRDLFGGSVSLSGDRALIGARVFFGASGSAYVFQRQADGSWTETAKLTADNGADGDERDLFGVSVSLSGDRALVGAPLEDNGSFSGSAYVFAFDGTRPVGEQWTQEAKLTADDADGIDYFGYSVSLSGDRALIGAFGDDSFSGSAYVFAFNGEQWTQEAKLAATNGGANGQFGVSVSLSGSRALVGANRDDNNGTNSGAAYLFAFDGIAWTQTAKLTASDGAAGDRFGNSVALSSNHAFVGATRNDDGGGANSGSTYVFELATNTPPIADAGPDQTVIAGQTVTLDGSESSDPDDDELTFAWTLASATLTGADTASPSFCAVDAVTYTAELVVSDGTDDDLDEVVVTAISPTAALDELASDVEALGGTLNSGQTNALTRKLTQAQRKLARGQDPSGQLGAFRSQVRSLEADGVLSTEQADALVASLDAITGVLASPCSASATAAPMASATVAPAGFALDAPYPNPASGRATVGFSVEDATAVRLAVYDALGRQVAVLIDGTVEAGRHTATLDGAALPTGTYLVRLTAGAQTATQRLTLLR